ncbi:MAG: protease modulator HflC [Azospirillum brasilense]|nr:MAG: protease modulator HflC [Azospirillum brasilense]
MNLLIKFGLAALLVLVLLSGSMFIVPQTQQALVLQFGDIKRVVKEPGLNFKLPFVQNVLFFDKRILDFKAQPAEFITKNRQTDVEERVVIDAFVRYRITDPAQFYKAVKNEANLNNRLNSIVLSSMRRVLANHSLSDLLSDKRSQIMDQIQYNVNAQARAAEAREATGDTPAARRVSGFGIEVVDVRIMRADLPSDISQSTYERMRKDFTKEAQRFRAEGEEKALAIRSGAERERTEIVAEARRKAETIRGEGDGEAAKIYASAYGRDPEFFKFYRSMQAYKRTLKQGDTTMVLSPDGEFLKELNP